MLGDSLDRDPHMTIKLPELKARPAAKQIKMKGIMISSTNPQVIISISFVIEFSNQTC
jgi:hypothetical protein